MKHKPWLLSAIGNFSVRIAGLTAAIVLARYLGPAGRGIVTEAMLWPTIVLACGALMNVQTSTFFVSRYDWSGLRACLALALKVTVVLVPVAMFVNWAVLGRPGKASFATANVYSLVIPGTLLASALAGVLLARARVSEFWLSKALPGMLTALSTLVLAATRQLTPTTFIVSTVLAALVTLGWMAWRARNMGGTETGAANLGSEVFAYGATTALVMVPYQLNLRLDQLLLSVLGDEHTLGLYAVATAWSSMLSVVGSGFSMVVLAQTAGAASSDDAIAATLFRKVRLAILLVAAAGLLAAAMAPWGLPLLYGSSFQDAVAPALILCVASIPLYTNIVLHDFTRGLGYPEVGVRPELVGLAVNLVMLFVLLPRFGPVGAAWACLLTYSIVTVLMIPGIMRKFPNLSVTALIPGQRDVRELIASGRSVASDLWGFVGVAGKR